jgi:preprotein translocase subunit YajC
MQTLNFLLMSPPAAGGQSNGGVTQIIMFGLIFVVFYFFMIRPQMKKAKEEKNFKESVKKGDRVITIGGIHGKIIEIENNILILEIDNGVRVKCEKSAISMESTRQLATVK